MNKYEKTLILNQHDFHSIELCVHLLLKYMKETNEKNGENTEFFLLRLKDSEKAINAKELTLEWASIKV